MRKPPTLCDKSCPERSAGCHGTCERYLAYERQRLAEQNAPSAVPITVGYIRDRNRKYRARKWAQLRRRSK